MGGIPREEGEEAERAVRGARGRGGAERRDRVAERNRIETALAGRAAWAVVATSPAAPPPAASGTRRSGHIPVVVSWAGRR